MCLFGVAFVCLASANADRIGHLLSEKETARCENEVLFRRALQLSKLTWFTVVISSFPNTARVAVSF